MRIRFTTPALRALRPQQKLYWVDDESLPGFRMNVTPAGNKSFAVRVRSGGRANRQDNTHTIGSFGVLTLEQAREQAQRVLARARLGEDVIGDKRRARTVANVSGLCAAFLAERQGKIRPRSHREYARVISKDIDPSFGKLPVTQLSRADVARWHSRKGREAPVAANRALRLLRTIYSWGVSAGEVPDGFSPTKEVKYFPETAKERYLSAEEVSRLGRALAVAETTGLPPDPKRAAFARKRAGRPQKFSLAPSNPFAVAAIRFLVLSGWREQEALTLRWDAIDFDAGRVLLEQTKSGRSHRELSAPALELLAELPREGDSPWVFPGSKSGEPLREIKHVWLAVRHAAGLDRVRLHDLRHTFASAGASAGFTLQMIGALLGHRDAKSTVRYAHLVDAAVKRAADVTATSLSAQLSGEKSDPAGLRTKRRS